MWLSPTRNSLNWSPPPLISLNESGFTVDETAPVTLAELTPYKARNGELVQAGCYGVSHGSGVAGELIRHATESWSGHAFLYIGNDRIVEGAAPVARVTSADDHPDAVWSIREPITDAQRLQVVARAHALVGCPYDWPALVGFALEVLNIKSGKQLDPMFAHDSYRVCSALVVDCFEHAEIDLSTAVKYPNLVSPADLYNRIAQRNS